MPSLPCQAEPAATLSLQCLSRSVGEINPLHRERCRCQRCAPRLLPLRLLLKALVSILSKGSCELGFS